MSLFLFSLFVLIPVIEIYLFIEIGGLLGATMTILLIITTALMGVGLVRHQGMHLLKQAQIDLAGGVPPVTALGHGAMLILAGALLVTPGFFTDSVGFLLLVPVVRLFLAEILLGALIPIDIFTRFSASPHTSASYDDKNTQAHDDITIETTFETRYTSEEPFKNSKNGLKRDK